MGLNERLTENIATLDRMQAEAKSPGRGSPQFIVRYPDEAMRAKIARLAKANGRSINAEIIDRLQKSMVGDTSSLEESIGDICDRIEKLEAVARDHEERISHSSR